MQPCLFAFGQLHLHLSRQNEGDFILDGENVVDRAVIAFGPDVRAAIGIDKLGRYANALTALANAALQSVSHTKLLCRLADIDCMPLVDEAGITRDDPQSG